MKKKLISLFIVMAFLVTLTIPVGAHEHKNSWCEECLTIDLFFNFNENSGYWHCFDYPDTVFIKGKGPTYDFDDGSYNSQVYFQVLNSKGSFFDQRKVVIFDGLTYLGNKMFSEYTRVKEIEIPNSVTKISETCFAKDSKVMIVCNKDSYAFEFAKEHNMKYWIEDSDMLGDAYADLELNSKDSLAIRKYNAGYNNRINLQAADINGDGKVNSKDSFTLRLYHANRIEDI